MFSGLSRDQISNPDFKEDSVRELVIVPILNRLGYSHSGEIKASRSKALTHPFIRIGTRNHPVTIIPDYTLSYQQLPIFILDAKSPTEDVLDPKHIQQAYSYAIHPEIKCREFGLCNGHSLATFSTDSFEPTLHLDFDDFETKWSEIDRILNPVNLKNPYRRKFDPDFGTALLKLGCADNTEHSFLGARLNFFARISDNMYTVMSGCELAGRTHCATFDFDKDLLEPILKGLPAPLMLEFLDALRKAPFQAAASLHLEIDVITKLGPPTRGEAEIFVPLVIQKVLGSRFVPKLEIAPPADIPDHIYQLHKRFKIREGKMGPE